METSQLRQPILAALGICAAVCAAPALVFADDAQDIQQLKDQVKSMQQQIDQMGGKSTKSPDVVATSSKPASTSLTWFGITLYGTIDMGVAYLSHGAPLSGQWGPGLPYFIQNFSNNSITSVAGNGLSQSKVGLSGVESLGFGDFSGVFRLETGFNPWSGRLVNGPGSLIDNNGKANAVKISAGDSSRAGQPFQGASYVGVSSPTVGTLTFGRQNGLNLDTLIKYDPQQQSQAFSPIGLSGTVGGMGTTEQNRFDNSLKYVGNFGPIHIGYVHQFGSDGYYPESADEGNIGFDIGPFSMDAVYGNIHGAVTAASLSAAQAAAEPPNTLAATVSDDTAYTLAASLNLKPVKLYAGWEKIKYSNPEHPLPAGFVGINGIVFSVVNNAAYNREKHFQAGWLGARWSVTPKFDLTGAMYGYWQTSYNANGCDNYSATNCAGTLVDGSVVGDYHFTKRFDAYLGMNYSYVTDGLASGYLFTHDTTYMTGVRFNF
jgi:predicted porin